MNKLIKWVVIIITMLAVAKTPLINIEILNNNTLIAKSAVQVGDLPSGSQEG